MGPPSLSEGGAAPRHDPAGSVRASCTRSERSSRTPRGRKVRHSDASKDEPRPADGVRALRDRRPERRGDCRARGHPGQHGLDEAAPRAQELLRADRRSARRGEVAVRPLREELGASDDTLATAARLVAQFVALETDRSRERRVRHRLRAETSRPFLLARAAFGIVLVLAGATTAMAMVTGTWKTLPQHLLRSSHRAAVFPEVPGLPAL